MLPKPVLGKTPGSLMLEIWGRRAAASDSGPGGIIDTIKHFLLEEFKANTLQIVIAWSWKIDLLISRIKLL